MPSSFVCTDTVSRLLFSGQVNADGTVLAPEHTLDQAMQFNQHAGQR
jgi:hypothetical protein